MHGRKSLPEMRKKWPDRIEPWVKYFYLRLLVCTALLGTMYGLFKLLIPYEFQYPLATRLFAALMWAGCLFLGRRAEKKLKEIAHKDRKGE